MAPRTITRRRRTQRQTTTLATNGQARTVLSQVSQLVEENRALARENKELHTMLAKIGQTVQKLTIRPISSTQRRVVAGETISTPRRGRRRQRQRITDPAALERRRAALAKARQVLAAKRAAQKRGSK